MSAPTHTPTACLPASGWRTVSLICRALRPYQWVKNILLLAPLLLAHRIADAPRWYAALLAMAAFSLSSSAVYVLNDLTDLASDREHPRKKHRPFASGMLSPLWGWLLAPLLSLSALAMAWLALPRPFLWLLLFYLCVATIYSLWLKRVVLLDVMILAVLYTTRILAGGLAVDVPLSTWLLAFSIFFFLSIAFVKRYAELRLLLSMGKRQAQRRDYSVEDMQLILSLGPAGGYLAVLVLSLYINSDEVAALYQQPWLLWLVCLCLLYWINRVWFLAHRGQMVDDPIVFTFRDRISYVVGLAVGLLVLAATL